MNFLLEKGYGFRCVTEVRVQPGLLRECQPLLERFGIKTLGLILDRQLKEIPYVGEVLDGLASGDLTLEIFEYDCREPQIADVEGCRDRLAAAKVDGILAVGGGSTMDLAKAVAVLLTNSGSPREYLGMDKLQVSGVPCLVAPSIAGSGAEITPSAVLIDKEKKFKGGINGRYVAPALALLDAELYRSCPVTLAAVSCYDALTHALESYLSTSGSPISRTFSRRGLELLLNNTGRLADEADSLEVRENLLLGSLFAVMGLMHALPGAIAGFAYPLGVLFDVPHGLAQAVITNECLRIHQERSPEIYAEFYDLLEAADTGLTQAEKSARFVNYMEEVYAQLELPTDLRQYGLTRETMAELVETVQDKRALKIDIVPFDRDDVIRVVEGII